MDEKKKKAMAELLYDEGHEVLQNLYVIVKKEDDVQDLRRLERILDDFKKLTLNKDVQTD